MRKEKMREEDAFLSRPPRDAVRPAEEVANRTARIVLSGNAAEKYANPSPRERRHNSRSACVVVGAW